MENFLYTANIKSKYDGIAQTNIFDSKSLMTIFSLVRFLIANVESHNGGFEMVIKQNDLFTIRKISYNNLDGLKVMVICREVKI